MSEPKSFWLTLPGLITAIGGLILAVGTFLTILNTIGVFKSPSLSLSVTSIDLGTMTTEQSFTITNSGGRTLRWNIISKLPDWLKVLPINGSVSSGKNLNVNLSVDKQGLDHGPYKHCILIKSNGGDASISVVMATKEPTTEEPTIPIIKEVRVIPPILKNRCLIDASRDGGVWWFPQAEPFNSNNSHQGKALADYLRSLSYEVLELPRPYTITDEILKDYYIVIRANGFGEYTQAEINAYQNYIQNGGNLLLLGDESTDNLARSFGIRFEGRTRDDNLITNYTLHPITQGVGPISYKGGALTSYPNKAQILGTMSNKCYLDLNNNSFKDPNEPLGPPVLGVMDRIVFCGDTNLWETVPQPLTNNVIQWFAK